jgi:hypothetical protein
MDPQNVTASLTLPSQLFVAPRGGEYFISPSISALKNMFVTNIPKSTKATKGIFGKLLEIITRRNA